MLIFYCLTLEIQVIISEVENLIKKLQLFSLSLRGDKMFKKIIRFDFIE